MMEYLSRSVLSVPSDSEVFVMGDGKKLIPISVGRYQSDSERSISMVKDKVDVSFSSYFNLANTLVLSPSIGLGAKDASSCNFDCSISCLVAWSIHPNWSWLDAAVTPVFTRSELESKLVFIEV